MVRTNGERLGTDYFMNENAQDPNSLRLPRSVLTVLIAVMVLLPLALIAFLWNVVPTGGELELPGYVTIETKEGERVLVLHNESQKPMTNIGISLNDAFHFYSPQVLDAGQEMNVALKAFARKFGQRYDPEAYPLTEVSIFARVGGGARGVLEHQGDDLLTELSADPPPAEQ